MRHLVLTSPHMHGGDVQRLQRKLGVHLVDGDFGPVTAAAVHHKKYVLGFPSTNLDGAGPFFQKVLFGKEHAGPAYQKRAAARAKAKAKRDAAAAKGAFAGDRACDFLEARVGRTERDGINRGDWLDKWEIENGHGRYSSPNEPGWPWCGIAVWMAYKHGAGIVLPGEVRSTDWIWDAAGAGTHGLHVVSFEQVRRGDLLLLFGKGVHVALARARPVGSNVPTVEGNTTFGPGGSQANGGALAKRERTRVDVVRAVRVAS